MLGRGESGRVIIITKIRHLGVRSCVVTYLGIIGVVEHLIKVFFGGLKMRITFSPKISLLAILIAGLWAHSSEAQWIRVNGPYVQGGYGGYPQQLTIGGDVAFISTDDGIFVSKDSGRTWLPINKGLPISFTGGITAMGSIFFTSAGSSLYSSSDHGEQWNYVAELPTTLTSSWIQSIGSNLYAVVDTGLYSVTTNLFLSTDTGRTWKTLESDLPGIYLLFSYGAYLLAGTDSGVFRSIDSGFTWAPVSTGINSDAEVLCFASMGSTLFAGANDSSIYQSSDSGKTWSNEGTSIPWYLGIYNIVVVGNDLIAAGNFPGLFRSSDTGKTWLYDTTIYPNTIQVPCLGLVGNTLVAGCENFELYSEDSGVTWKPSSSGFGYYQVGNIITFAQKSFCTNGFGVYQSIDSGLNWFYLPGSPTDDYSFGSVENDLVVSTDSGISISRDSGVSWTLEDTTAKDFSDLTTIGPSLFAISYSRGILYSSDEGDTWDTINGGLALGDKIGVLGDKLIATDGHYFYVSISKSSGWSQLNIDENFHGGVWTTDSNFLYLLDSYNGLYVTSNVGKTWTPINAWPNNDQGRYTSIAVSGDDIFISSYEGTYISTDHGQNWTSPSLKVLPDPSSFIFVDGYAFAITEEDGLFRENIPNAATVLANSQNGDDLISINPNPATDRATINFNIAQAFDGNFNN